MTKPTVTMRFDCPSRLNYQLHNLASHLGVPLKDILHDGLCLALRYHGHAQGVPQPPLRTPPAMPEQEVEDQEQPVESEEPVEKKPEMSK